MDEHGKYQGGDTRFVDSLVYKTAVKQFAKSFTEECKMAPSASSIKGVVLGRIRSKSHRRLKEDGGAERPAKRQRQHSPISREASENEESEGDG